MRARSTVWAAFSAAALLAVLVAPPAEAKRVRVFAMGPKLDISWLESRQTYRDKLFALFDRRLRGPGKPLVQRGADDAASHLRGKRRDLVLWPESLGLFAALTGERGRSARAAGSLEAAIVTILGTYAPQNAYYGARYPDLPSRFPPTRLLALSLTDTFGRTVVEPMAEMADRYDVYLEVGVDMAQSWQVVCVDKASFHHPRLRCDEQNPAKVAQLRDPEEPTRDYAYEATSDKASVMALLFGPDGRLVARRIKSYIVPIETGQAEGQLGLDLVPGSTSERRSDVRPVRTPVGTLGFTVSKPAWMPDVVDKLDQQHVDLLVQPEFFSDDLVASNGMWAPDTSSHPATTTFSAIRPSPAWCCRSWSAACSAWMPTRNSTSPSSRDGEPGGAASSWGSRATPGWCR